VEDRGAHPDRKVVPAGYVVELGGGDRVEDVSGVFEVGRDGDRLEHDPGGQGHF
jgi:hypothetical protein